MMRFSLLISFLDNDRLTGLRDPREAYREIAKSCDLSQITLDSPRILDERGVLIHPNDYGTRLNHGTVVAVQVLYKLYGFLLFVTTYFSSQSFVTDGTSLESRTRLRPTLALTIQKAHAPSNSCSSVCKSCQIKESLRPISFPLPRTRITASKTYIARKITRTALLAKTMLAPLTHLPMQ